MVAASWWSTTRCSTPLSTAGPNTNPRHITNGRRLSRVLSSDRRLQEVHGLGLPMAGSDFNFDYRVSFTEDELAAGQVDYNPFPMSEAPVPACSSRTAKGASRLLLHLRAASTRAERRLRLHEPGAKGRDEDGKGQFWVRRRDEYPDELATAHGSI